MGVVKKLLQIHETAQCRIPAKSALLDTGRPEGSLFADGRILCTENVIRPGNARAVIPRSIIIPDRFFVRQVIDDIFLGMCFARLAREIPWPLVQSRGGREMMRGVYSLSTPPLTFQNSIKKVRVRFEVEHAADQGASLRERVVCARCEDDFEAGELLTYPIRVT